MGVWLRKRGRWSGKWRAESREGGGSVSGKGGVRKWRGAVCVEGRGVVCVEGLCV